jgi:HAE1 family hydrophobic/amphiphilic exporter-1
VPVSFMSCIIGQYFRQFGLSVAAEVFFSLLVARLLTPVIAAYTLKSEPEPQRRDGRVMAGYLRVLNWCVYHRWKTIGLGVLFFVASIYGLAMLPKTFIQEPDTSAASLEIDLPPGVQLAVTVRVANAAFRFLSRQKAVQAIDESMGVNGSVRKANLSIVLVPPSERRLTQVQWQNRMLGRLRAIPNAQMYFQNFNGDSNGHDITIDLTGENLTLLEHTARKVMRQMAVLPSLRDVSSEDDLPRPEIRIRPRFDLAAQLGVTVADISRTIRIATLGDLLQDDAKFTLPDRQVPILVNLKRSARSSLTTLENLPVPTADGGTVPLQAVAAFSFGEGPTQIHSRDQRLRIAINANLNSGVQLGQAMKEIHALPALAHLPSGVHLDDSGNARLMSELFTDFLIAMGSGVLMVFAVLVLLFARLLQPLTILSALPLSIGGAVAALYVTGEPLSLGVMIGFLMLMGIVAKNSILLVDFAIEEMRAGKDRVAALLEAGHKRARPIVMTTVAMVAGMLPVALAFGDPFRAPMAIAVIGGLLASTALTLVVVPAGFTLVDDIERWIGPRRRCRRVSRGEGSASKVQRRSTQRTLIMKHRSFVLLWTALPLMALASCSHTAVTASHGSISIAANAVRISVRGAPRATIESDGSLLIGRRAVALSPAEQRLARRYYRDVLQISAASETTAEAGGKLGVSVFDSLFSALWRDNSAIIKHTAKHGAARVTADARTLCAHLARLETLQNTLGADQPAFAPYRIVRHKDVTGCLSGTRQLSR